MKSKRTKVVKGWVILHKSRNSIAGDISHLYIYDEKPLWYTGNRVVPCTITYSLRHTKKIKKVKK